MSIGAPVPNIPDTSSNLRKVSVPALAGAITVLVVIGLHLLRAPISTDDYAVGAGALAAILSAVGDLVIPPQYLQ